MLDLLFVLLPGRERLIATAQPDETSLIYRTVPTCAYIFSIFYIPVPGRDLYWIERMKPVPAYRQPCFLPTPPTPDGDIDLAAPEPATAASLKERCPKPLDDGANLWCTRVFTAVRSGLWWNFQVAKMTTVRVLLALAASKSWKLWQMDVKNAFLHRELDREIYTEQPQGFESQAHPDYVCKLALLG